MQREPIDVAKRDYFNMLNIRKFKPRFMWYQCASCGSEYKGEYMFECAEPSMIFTFSHYYRGCTHCFNRKEDFEQWLIDNKYICTEESFIKAYKKRYN